MPRSVAFMSCSLCLVLISINSYKVISESVHAYLSQRLKFAFKSYEEKILFGYETKSEKYYFSYYVNVYVLGINFLRYLVQLYGVSGYQTNDVFKAQVKPDSYII
jgi:hypothetical protein